MAMFPAVPRPVQGDVPDTSSWVRALARLGYAAKGVVYVVVGLLAVQAARTPAEDIESSEGALQAILTQPFGRTVLVMVAVGLAGYVLWRLVQAIADPEHKGTDAKGIATRGGYLISALIHAGLTLEAVRLLSGTAGGGGGQRADHWTAVVMRQPMGRWAVALVGAGIIAFGFFELHRAVRSRLDRKLRLSGLGAGARTGIIRLGRLGYAARGVVFGIIGWFLIQAALHVQPSEATDLAGALQMLRTQWHGPWLLGAVALGLIAYGLWQLVAARYRRIQP